MAPTLIIVLLVFALGAVAAACLRLRTRRGALQVGVDIVEVEAVVAALASPRAERYLALVYGPGERRDCTTAAGIEASRLAARFAAKEAVRKAIGRGALELPWTSIQVMRGSGGEPLVRLEEAAALAARRVGLRRFALSLTHEPGYAAAMVVATR